MELLEHLPILVFAVKRLLYAAQDCPSLPSSGACTRARTAPGGLVLAQQLGALFG